MDIYVDTTTVIALGAEDRLEQHLTCDGRPVLTPAVIAEVTSEPSKTNLE